MTNPETPATQSFSRHSSRDAEAGVWTRYYTAGSLDDAIKATLQSKSDALPAISAAGKTVVVDPMTGPDPEVVASLGGRILTVDDLGPESGLYDPLRFGR